MAGLPGIEGPEGFLENNLIGCRAAFERNNQTLCCK